MDLDALIARAEITDCLHRYTRGMDRLDRELARSAYHDDAVDDHAGFVAGVEAFLDWAFDYHAGQVRHQHHLTNISIDLELDARGAPSGVAHVESYYTFVASYADDESPVFMTGGRYLDRLEERDGRWAIAARVCTAEWRTKVPSKLTMEAAAVLAPGVARDRTDVSYRRPLVIDPPS
jgi:hypothetical protein